jgi:CheY-like chemotaxis protein
MRRAPHCTVGAKNVPIAARFLEPPRCGGVALSLIARGDLGDVIMTISDMGQASGDRGTGSSRTLAMTHADESGYHEHLRGLRVLVAEDEVLISMDIEGILDQLGCCVSGLAMSIDVAQRILDSGEPFDVAILDVNLAGQPIYPLAQQLVVRGCPFLFITGYGAQGLLNGWRDRPTVQKPFRFGDIRDGLLAAVASAGDRSA